MKIIKVIKFIDFHEFDVSEIFRFINGNHMVVIFIDTRISCVLDECFPYLNQIQIGIAFKYERENDRINYAVTKAIVNLFYSEIEKIECQEVQWRYEKYNKPYILNHFGININISHTKGGSIVIFSRSNVGIDIENFARDIDYIGIENNFFSHNEKPSTLKGFYKYWVSKEAYLKYTGVGLNQSLNSVEVIDEKNSIVKVVDRRHNIQKDISILEVENFIFAICY